MSEPKRSKASYKTINWAAYNAALKARGSLTIWLVQFFSWLATRWTVMPPMPERSTALAPPALLHLALETK